LKKFNFILTGVLTTALIFPGTALGSTITVERGDTLSKLAVENKTTVANLKTVNNLKSDVIYVGQKLQTTAPVANTTKTGIVTNATYLNVRTGPDVSYKSIATIKNGTKVIINSQKNGWLYITFGNNKGYVSSKYINVEVKVTVASTKIFNKPSEGVITSNFGPRTGTVHKGIDFAKAGNIQIKAAAEGEVSRSYLHSSYGEVVFIRHEINGQKYETVYAHMKSGSRAVKVGDKVTEGQFLGWMGSTGNSTGQHLHFEVHLEYYIYGKTHQNPLLYIK
jgi:murein DD-endopeptidase MepM/ murein hydrolase activator NlpD